MAVLFVQLVVVILFLSFSSGYRSSDRCVQCHADAKKMIKDGAIYLDVRLPGEYNNARLAGSINIPLAAIRTEMTSIDREKEYIVYCDTGRRSTSAVFLLGQFGIEAHVLIDGLANVPMEDYSKDEEEKNTGSAEIIDINHEEAQVFKGRKMQKLPEFGLKSTAIK